MKLTSYLIPAIVIVIVGGFVLWYANREKEPGRYDAFAQCIAEKGVKMYGAYWCPHCQNQKELFGSSFIYVPYVECAIRGSRGQTKECDDAGIKGYPTWIFVDGERREGELTLDALSQKTSCALP